MLGCRPSRSRQAPRVEPSHARLPSAPFAPSPAVEPSHARLPSAPRSQRPDPGIGSRSTTTAASPAAGHPAADVVPRWRAVAEHGSALQMHTKPRVEPSDARLPSFRDRDDRIQVAEHGSALQMHTKPPVEPSHARLPFARHAPGPQKSAVRGYRASQRFAIRGSESSPSGVSIAALATSRISRQAKARDSSLIANCSLPSARTT